MLRVRPEPPTAVRKRRAAMMMMLGAAAFLACADEEALPGPEASAESVLATEAAGVPEPADNPANPSKVELGRLLFWDPILAGDRDIARPPGTAEGGEETAS
jgi:cytochrome c peroxidase